MAGAVLNALNIRLEADTIAYILDHSESKVLLTDTEFSAVVKDALALSKSRPQVIDIIDDLFFGPGQAPGERLGETTYEELLAEGDAGFAPLLPADEWQAIALNYTSGTTGRPKGVVYHHRGAYLNAIGDILVWSMGLHPIYLWTLPMFHCNGWCFPWAIALQGGTQVCLRRVEPGAIYAAVADHQVTHLCGAPIVMGMLINATPEQRRDFDHKVEMMTAAAPPPAAVLQKMAELGVRVTHVYGLTEVYGPATVCAWQEEWDALPPVERARLQARQGVCYPVLEGLEVMDPETMQPVPRDGETIGEIMMRGHDVMKGYFKNPEATEAAFRGGWFHTGDLAVMHEDGYIDIKDRSKDIIISGGENISSIEVEGALYRHPAVLEAAVVARPDATWGETPCAFVTLKAGAKATEQELIEHCRSVLARFKAPKTIVFTELPKTSTGKVQKTVLRDQARAL
jgi:fatty-acyl-CoA synthase